MTNISPTPSFAYNIPITQTTLTGYISTQSTHQKNHKQLKFIEMIKRSHQSKNVTNKLPTVRQMIQTINDSETPSINNTSTKITKQNLFNLQPGSMKSILSHHSDHASASKRISKLIFLKDKNKQQNQNQSQRNNQMQSEIYSLIDQILTSSHTKSFYSQPHFAATGDSSKRKNKSQRLSDSTLMQSTTQLVTAGQTYRTIDFGKSSQKFMEREKCFSKMEEEINKIQTEKTYMNTIRDLDLKRKFCFNKKNLSQAVDLSRGERQSLHPETERKQMTILLDKKDQRSRDKRKLNSQQKNNKYMGKLFSGSVQKQLKTREQSKNIFKLEKQRQISVIRQKKNTQLNQYKKKGKEYFHIQLRKKSIHPPMDKDNKSQQLLPQIKVNGKGQS